MNKEEILLEIKNRISNKNADIKAMANGGQYIQAHELSIQRDELIFILNFFYD